MDSHGAHRDGGAYGRLGLELAIDFAIMYFVMYTMIETGSHLYLNVNNVYMTLMMVSPMAIVMLLSMRSMFPSAARNRVIIGVALVVLALGYAAMRRQTAVGDRQFLRSMIPHHSGAILMCQEASLTRPEIIRLCKEIVESQREEIAKMEALLAAGE